MTDHSESIAKVLSRAFFAVHDQPLYAGSSQYAAEVFQTLLRYYGLTVVSTCGLVVRGNIDEGPLDLVTIDSDGNITPPDLKQPYSPELAHRLGVALIAGAHISTERNVE